MGARRTRIWLAVVALVVLGAAAGLWTYLSPRGPARGPSPAAPDSGDAIVEDPESAVGSTSAMSPAPIAPRTRTHAVWSGEELLVWSGAVPPATGEGAQAGNEPFDVLDDGAAFDPAAGSWRHLPDAPISGRAGAAAVWAGDRFVVWGGFGGFDEARDDGAAYLPGEDVWQELPPAPIDGRGDVTAVWTGEEVLIVGGAERAGRPGGVTGIQRDGAAYDPATNRWRPVPAIPDGVWQQRDRGVGPIRERFAGTWTGDALVVWGRDLGVYDPSEDAWERVSVPPTSLWLGGGVQAVSVGEGVAILGLLRRDDPDTFGLVYEPARDAFDLVPALAPAAMRGPRQAAAAGEQGVVLLSDPASAAVWRPGDRRWRPLPAAAGRGTEAAVVWTGDELLIWGGTDGTSAQNDGVVWHP